MIILPMSVLSFSPILLGKWKPHNVEEFTICVMEESIIGSTSKKQSVEMEIKEKHENRIVLDKIKIREKPTDWLNVIKYKNYIMIFNEIKKYGLVCEFLLIGEDRVEIRPQIGNKKYSFVLERFTEKNDFRNYQDNK